MRKYNSMFMEVAEITSKQSNCVKYKVGAVIVKDNRIILQGYNGTVSGFINCSEKFSGVDFSDVGKIHVQQSRELHTKWSAAFEVHAEMNVICYAARYGISLNGTTMYCTHSPCNNCLKHLISSGVARVIYKNDYVDNSNLYERDQLLKFIKLEKYEG